MSNPIFGNHKKYDFVSLWSAELAQRVVKAKQLLFLSMQKYQMPNYWYFFPEKLSFLQISLYKISLNKIHKWILKLLIRNDLFVCVEVLQPSQSMSSKVNLPKYIFTRQA